MRGQQTLRRALNFKIKVFEVRKFGVRWREKERGCDDLRWVVILLEPAVIDRP